MPLALLMPSRFKWQTRIIGPSSLAKRTLVSFCVDWLWLHLVKRFSGHHCCASSFSVTQGTCVLFNYGLALHLTSIVHVLCIIRTYWYLCWYGCTFSFYYLFLLSWVEKEKGVSTFFEYTVYSFYFFWFLCYNHFIYFD